MSSVSKRKKGTFFLTASLPDVVWNLIGVFSIFSGVKNNGLVNKVAEGNYLKGPLPYPVKLPICYLKKRVSFKKKSSEIQLLLSACFITTNYCSLHVGREVGI